MKLFSYITLLFSFVLIIGLSSGANADYSCIKSCMSNGRSLHTCNSACTIRKASNTSNRIMRAKRPAKNTPLANKDIKTREVPDQECYYDCLGRGGSTSSCTKSCVRIVQEESPSGYNLDSNISDLTGQGVDCILKCIASDDLTAACLGNCNSPSTGATTATNCDDDSGDFSGVDYG